jgi:hypothetical protein
MGKKKKGKQTKGGSSLRKAMKGKGAFRRTGKEKPQGPPGEVGEKKPKPPKP